MSSWFACAGWGRIEDYTAYGVYIYITPSDPLNKLYFNFHVDLFFSG